MRISSIKQKTNSRQLSIVAIETNPTYKKLRIDYKIQSRIKKLYKNHSRPCHIMHLGKKIRQFEYDIPHKSNNTRRVISFSDWEKDLGVMVSSDRKVDKLITKKTTTANKMLGLLLNSFFYIDQKSYRTLYCTFVRSQFEFVESVWSPHLEMHIEKLERIQRRANAWVSQQTCPWSGSLGLQRKIESTESFKPQGQKYKTIKLR